VSVKGEKAERGGREERGGVEGAPPGRVEGVMREPVVEEGRDMSEVES
jgi:hypothetical protein